MITVLYFSFNLTFYTICNTTYIIIINRFFPLVSQRNFFLATILFIISMDNQLELVGIVFVIFYSKYWRNMAVEADGMRDDYRLLSPWNLYQSDGCWQFSFVVAWVLNDKKSLRVVLWTRWFSLLFGTFQKWYWNDCCVDIDAIICVELPVFVSSMRAKNIVFLVRKMSLLALMLRLVIFTGKARGMAGEGAHSENWLNWPFQFKA